MVKFPDILTNIGPFKQWYNGFKRRIQTTVEHMRVTNVSDGAMVRGELIALVAGRRQAVLTDADDAALVCWAGVMTEPTPDDATGIARINGKAFVLFEAALDPAPAAGDSAYVSNVPGRATNDIGTPTRVLKIGTVADASTYASTGGCYVYVNRCCTPTQMAM